MTNLWHVVKGVQILDLGEKRFLFKFFHRIDMIQIHDVPKGFRNEALARQLGDFFGKFVKYDNASLGRGFLEFLTGHGDSFCSARMPLRVEVAEMGWDLSLRAKSKRALTINIIWLKEEEVWEKKDHDSKESTIEWGKGKKWAKRESDVCTNETNMGSLVVKEGKGMGRNYLLSMVAKGQANRLQ
ncbi:hypothetical protein J1N35_021867 [Gossypium stocksii]|uniref:DUF4283 domain-containing protein n=1 Tax=Gossypium stocksii TaxID=47602 RepID=A0A9D3VFB5_9ROSI|nr:hypothetical protein J1N35_021867 [Gossypium stocksii]